MTRVLIVDDNAENRYMLRALLQGHGYTVDEASQGVEALAAARQNPPDMAISDLLMPVMDGYTFLHHWRADEKLKSIAFVVYTATYTEPKDERLALALGADAFIIKPSEPEAFMARIHAVCAKYEHGELPPAPRRSVEENALLNDYNEVLIRKLEKKTLLLEQANRELLDEVAERRRTENALRDSEADLRLRDRAIQAVSQGIVITDTNQPGHPIIFASSGFERITGYRSDEVLGKNCRFLQGKDTDKETVATLRESIAAGRACAVEILNYRKDGTPFWNALSLDPVHDEKGVLAHYVGVQNDITERRNLEDQLRQSQKMEAMGQLSGGVAHDFNNLLSIICGYSHLMLMSPMVSGTVRDRIKGINDAGERAAMLTRQLLGFSRQTILQPKVLDLNAVVAETAKLLRRLIGEHILFTTVLGQNLNQVKVDPSQFDQVLMNLTVNARDAMPKGGKLTLETSNVMLSDNFKASHLEGKAGPHVMLTVSDTGCGIPPEIKDRIFEPFFTTKEVGKGTGLGLAMVFGIVKQSGGFIHVYSERGQGTTFKIYLPAVSEQPVSASDSSDKLDARGTETILVVEDEAGVRGMTLASLEMFGYKVLIASDGADALKIVQACEGQLDLVLTDMVMPNMSGPDLASNLRVQFPKVNVLFMSGYTDDAVVRHGLLEAKAAFIQKPFTPQGLARKVRQVLDGKRA